MISIKISSLLIRKFLTVNVFMMIMIAVSMFFLSCTLTASSSPRILLTATKNLRQEKAVYSYDAEIDDYGLNAFEILPGLKSIEHKYFANCSLNNENFSFVACSSILAEGIKMPLAKGKWFTDAPVYEGKQNVVVSYDAGYKVGDEIEFTVWLPDGEIICDAVVVGILPRKSYYLSLSSYGKPTTIDLLFNSLSDNSNKVILTENNFENLYESSSVIYVFDDTISDDQLNENINTIKSYVGENVISIDELAENTEYVAKEEAKIYLPITFVFSILELASLIVISLVVFKKSENIIYAAQLSGCSKIDLAKIFITYFSIIFMVSALLYTGLLCFGLNPLTSIGVFMPNAVALVVIPLCFALVLIGLGVFISMMYSSKKIKIYR